MFGDVGDYYYLCIIIHTKKTVTMKTMMILANYLADLNPTHSEICISGQGTKRPPKYHGPVLDKPKQKAQGRNEPCSCGSGKKAKKCCLK